VVLSVLPHPAAGKGGSYIRLSGLPSDRDPLSPDNQRRINLEGAKRDGEADSISWRMSQFHAAARRKGLWAARRPFGYLVEDYKLRPHPKEAPIVRRVVDEFLGGACSHPCRDHS
jgi:DNA invertase Pin-like site-specific DNA recombinase